MTQQTKTGPAPAPDLHKIAALIDATIGNQENSIIGRQALLLRTAADELRAAAGAAA